MKPRARGAPAVRAEVAVRWFLASVAVALAAAGAVTATQPPSNVLIVEEDWQLVIREPDPDRNAPQVTCVVSPVGNLEGVYAAFDLNHRSQPYYLAGGLQLQYWSGESCLENNKFSNTSVAATANETVRWTTRMRLLNGRIYFSVRNGTSTTWSNFGTSGSLRINRPTTLSNLNGYDSNVSVQHSGVGFAANRVDSLTLLRVRRTLDTGEVVTDNESRSVNVE